MSLFDLDQRFSIVDSQGKPTEYFMRLLRDRGSSQETVEEKVNRLDGTVTELSNSEVLAGLGLSGGGALKDAPITLDLDATLNNLKDVNAPAPTDSQVLSFEAATGLWVPATASSGGSSKTYGGAAPADSSRSSTAFSTKGTILQVLKKFTVSEIIWTSTVFVGGSYVARIYELNAAGTTIVAVAATSPTLVITATEDNKTIIFEVPPTSLDAGKNYAFVLSRLDAGDTNAIPIAGSGTYSNAFGINMIGFPAAFVRGWLSASTNPTIGSINATSSIFSHNLRLGGYNS